MVAPLAMEALQWPVKMLRGRMLKSPDDVAPTTPAAASGVVSPPPIDEAETVKTTANTTNKK
jgi:hypothetical protein